MLEKLNHYRQTLTSPLRQNHHKINFVLGGWTIKRITRSTTF